MPLGLFYLRLIQSRWRLVAALVLGCTAVAWAWSALVLARDPVYESAARLNIVPTSEELGYASRFVRGSTFDGGGVLLQTYAEFAHTRPVVAPIVDRWIAEHAAAAGQGAEAWVAANTEPPAFSPGRLVAALNYGTAPVLPLREELIAELIENITVETVAGTYLIRLGVAWDDPADAAWFANALADAVVARALTQSQASGNKIASTLEQRLAERSAQLADLRRRSRVLKAQLSVVDIDRQKQSLLEEQVAEQSRLTGDRAALLASQSQVSGLRRRVDGPLSPAQQTIEQTLAVEAPRSDGLRRGVALRESRVGQIGAQIARLGANEQAVKTLDDDVAALQTEVTALTERVSFSQTENLANAPRIQLIERALPPVTRSSPKILFNTILGFIAGCALAGIALLLLGPAPASAREDDDEPSRGVDGDRKATVAESPITPAPKVSPSPVAETGPASVPFVHEPAPASAATAVPEPMPAPASAPASVAAPPPDPISTPVPKPAPAPVPTTALDATNPATLGAAALAVDAIPVNEPAPPPVAPTTRHRPAPVPPLPHLYPATLPRPADGIAYDQAETARLLPPLLAWLAGPLANPATAILVAGAGRDIDAQLVYRLLYDHFRATAAPFRVIDATAGPRPIAGADDPRRPLIYAGGFRESGRVTTLADADAATALVVVLSGEPAARADLANSFAEIAGRPPYVIPLDG